VRNEVVYSFSEKGLVTKNVDAKVNVELKIVFYLFEWLDYISCEKELFYISKFNKTFLKSIS